VPIFDKFFLGGANTVRGYGEGVLGPKNVDGDPVGGEVTGLANLEIRRPRQVGPIGMLFFADAGQVWRDPGHMRRRFKLKYGAGIEAFIDTPIGPVRVGYGWKVVPNPRQGDVFKGGVLHFSVMYAF
jgi:outer membrane protein insertion porin family